MDCPRTTVGAKVTSAPAKSAALTTVIATAGAAVMRGFKLEQMRFIASSCLCGIACDVALRAIGATPLKCIAAGWMRQKRRRDFATHRRNQLQHEGVSEGVVSTDRGPDLSP